MQSDAINPSIEELQKQIHDLSTKLDKVLRDRTENADERLQSKRDAIVSQVRDNDGVFSRVPLYILTCRPAEKVEIKGLFGGYKEQVVRLFDEPPSLREGGFNLATSGRASTNVGGEFRLLSVSGYQARFVSREGICGVIAVATNDFMGWGTGGGTSKAIRFNPMVLAEFTYEFCRFAEEVLSFATPTAPELIFELELFGFDSHGVTLELPKGRISQVMIISAYPPTTLDHTDVHLRVEMQASEKPERIALRLLQELYIKNGFEGDVVPYANSNKDEIDTEAFGLGR